MEEYFNQIVKGANEMLNKLPSVMDQLKDGYVQKYGNEELINKYIALILTNKHDEADLILKQLEDGK